MILIFVLVEVFRTHKVENFDLSSFDSVNMLAEIDNKRALSLESINQSVNQSIYLYFS